MTKRYRLGVGRRCAVLCLGVFCAGAALAQRGGGSDWKTAGFDAQRTSWKRTDRRLSLETIPSKFQFLWQFKVPNQARQLNSLTQPAMLDGLHSYTGMRTTLVVGASSGAAYSIDADLGRLEWKHSFAGPATASAGSLACPGGVTSSFTRSVTLEAQTAQTQAGGRGGTRGRHAEGLVGAPDQGAPNLAADGAAAGGRGGRGGGGRGAAAAFPVPPGEEGAEGGAPAGRGRGGRGGMNLGSTDAFYSVDGAGMVHLLNVMDGSDLVPPFAFLPANANVSGLILFDRVLYAATTNNCGGVANGMWAINLASPDKTVTSWKSDGGGSAGTLGPAVGTDGKIYLATADGEYSPTNYSDAVVALEPKTLALKDYFTPGKVAFDSSPVVFPYSGKDWIVAAGKEGRLYLLDSASLGGSDHHTPADSTTPLTNSTTDFSAGALATWEGDDKTRWVLAPAGGALASNASFPMTNGKVTNGAVVAFKVIAQNGKTTLQPAWVSRDMVAPATPMIINGVVFALGTGEYHTGDAKMTAAQRAQHSVPAILYALDAATGKELWNSGKTITSFVHSGGLSSGNSQVYLSTWDSVLYAFGVPMER